MLKESQKRTCLNCKALHEETGYRGFGCDLGYKISYDGRPLEPCFKPKTISEFIEARTLLKMLRNTPTIITTYG